MYIWRVEDDYGQGCYQAHLPELEDMYTKHKNPFKYPTPYKDNYILRVPIEEEICGFKNIEQLKNWFNEDEIIMLKEVGFKIKKIEVKKITAYGEKQVLAIR